METKIQDAVFRVIDCEATGRDPATARICEVAWWDVCSDGEANYAARFSSLINPGIPIPPGASAVHHLVDEDVANSPSWEAFSGAFAWPDLFAAHGADYDATITGLPGTWLCTHRLAKHLWPEIENHSNQEIRYHLKLAVDLAKDTPPHRAAADVTVTAAILVTAMQKVLKDWPEVQTVRQLIKRVNAPCRIIHVPFKSAGGVKFVDAETGLLEWIINKQAGGEDCIHTAGLVLAERFPHAFNFNPDEDEGE